MIDVSALVIGYLIGVVWRYRKQRNEARDERDHARKEEDYWQKRACRHEAMVNALATIPKQRIESYSMTFSNN